MKNIQITTQKNILKIFFLCFLINVTSVKSELSITDIHGLDAIVHENYKHLSLVQGALWWDNHVIENLYKNGNKQHATIQLLRNLFYLQRDLVTFDITTLNRNPARYFKESTIGIILAILEPYTKDSSLTEEIKKELFMKLKTSIKSDIHFKDLYYAAKITKEEIVKSAINSSEDFAHLIRLKKINNNIITLKEQQKDAPKNIFMSIAAKLTKKYKKQKKLTKQYGSLIQLEKKPDIKKIHEQLYKEDLSKKNLHDLIHHIINAFDENLSKKNQYPPFTIQQIFLSFLWKIMESKDPLILFIKNFKDHYQIDTEVFDEKALQTYLTLLPYTRNDFEYLKTSFSPDITIKNVLQDYEKTVFFLFASTIWDNLLPPLIDSVAESKYKNIKFPDCVETAIRNLINSIMFNPNLFNFKLTLNEDLIKKGVVFDKKFNNFYLQHSDPLKAQFLKVHNAWNKVVSERSGVIYNKPEEKPICEMTTSADNVMNVISYCMFGNASTFENLSLEEKFDTLCSCAQQLNLTWEPSASLDTKNLNNVIITFKHNHNPIFSLAFEPAHCYLTSLLKIIKQYQINFSSLISNFEPNPSHYQDFINNNKITNILLFNIEEAQIWLITLSQDPLFTSKIHPLLKAITPFLGIEDTLLFAKKIILNKRKKLYAIIEEFIQKNIASNSPALFKLILENHVQELYDVAQNSFSKLSKENQQLVLQDSINFKVSEFYPLVQKEFPNFSQILSKYILKNANNDLFFVLEKSYNPKNKKKVFSFFKLIIKFDSKIFYPLIQKDILLLNQEEQLQLIKKIMQKRRAELYPLVEQLEPELPHAMQKKLKKVFSAQKQVTQLSEVQKKLKKTFRTLLKKPTESTNKEFVDEIMLFKNMSEDFRKKLPRSNKDFATAEITLLKNIKKLWDTLIKKVTHIYETVLEDDEKNTQLTAKVKATIKTLLKQLKDNKKQEVGFIKSKIASLKEQLTKIQ